MTEGATLWLPIAESQMTSFRMDASPVGRFNFNLLFALDAILHAQTLTEAAASIHLSQPAMSVSLRKLRGMFNDDLVQYANGRAQLTALAVTLRPRIRSVLHAAREAVDLNLRFDPAIDRGVLTMTAPDTVELVFLRKVFSRIATMAPHVACLSAPFYYKAVDQLFREPLDIAVISEAFAQPDYSTEPLFTDSVSCMVWSEHPTIGDDLTERQYFDGRHASVYHASERRTHPIGVAFRDLDRRRNVVLRASAHATLAQMIVGTDLMVTTLTSFARHCAAMLPLRVLPLPFDMPAINFVAQWQSYRNDEPIIRWSVEQLKAVAAGI